MALTDVLVEQRQMVVRGESLCLYFIRYNRYKKILFDGFTIRGSLF